MGVLTEIAKRVLRTAKGRFRVDHPFEAEQRAKPRREGLRVLKRSEDSVKTEFVLRMQFFKAIHELAPEDRFESAYWQEELVLRADPSRLVRADAAGGNHTMNVRMVQQPPTIP